MICKIITPKVQYRLSFTERVSVIRGMSGTGKSYIIQILNNLNDVNYYVCERRVATVPAHLEVDIELWLDTHSGFLLFADANVTWVCTGKLLVKLEERDIWLVTMSRRVRGKSYILRSVGSCRYNIPM